MTIRMFVILVLVLAIGGGGFALARHDVPPPRHMVEKTIDNARFFK